MSATEIAHTLIITESSSSRQAIHRQRGDARALCCCYHYHQTTSRQHHSFTHARRQKIKQETIRVVRRRSRLCQLFTPRRRARMLLASAVLPEFYVITVNNSQQPVISTNEGAALTSYARCLRVARHTISACCAAALLMARRYAPVMSVITYDIIRFTARVCLLQYSRIPFDEITPPTRRYALLLFYCADAARHFAARRLFSCRFTLLLHMQRVTINQLPLADVTTVRDMEGRVVGSHCHHVALAVAAILHYFFYNRRPPAARLPP